MAFEIFLFMYPGLLSACGRWRRPAGDARNAPGVLEWLLDDENRELVGEIEEINARMLERLLDESPFVAVFFCKWPQNRWWWGVGGGVVHQGLCGFKENNEIV